MPFYTRHPLDTLLLSDPFLSSLLSPSTNNRQEGSGKESNIPTRAFSPNFDVHETPKEYILEGELAGLEKKNLSIEFTDNNTLLIRGKIERSYSAGTPPKSIEGGAQKPAITEGGETQTKGKEKEKDEKAAEKHEDDSPKYWVSERTVGSFQRSFSFPGEVDEENVKASLEHGILKIVVPKKEKRAARKIDIF